MSVTTPGLTKQSQEVLLLADEWAQTRGAAQIGAEHLLLALADDEQGLAAVALRACGVDLAKLLQILPLPQSATAQSGDAVPPPSPSFELAGKLAADEARALGHRYVQTGHLLLGLLATGDTTALGMLEECGATAERVRDEMLQMLRAPDAPASERSSIEEAEIERVQWPSDMYTESAVRVLASAAREAQSAGSAMVEDTHLLLALAEMEGTIASAVLLHLGVDVDRLRATIADGARSAEAEAAEKFLRQSGKAVIEQAVAEARRLRHRRIGPGHLLLALTAMPEGEAIAALRAIGAPVRRLRALALQMTRRAYDVWPQRLVWSLYYVAGAAITLVIYGLVIAAGIFLSVHGFGPSAVGAALVMVVLLHVAARASMILAARRHHAKQRR